MGQVAEPLEPIWFPAAGGIQMQLDPDDLPPGALADCCNVDLLHPQGTLRPRAGSRSLCNYNSSPNNGHPLSPLGNKAFDFSARIVRLIADDSGRILYALAVTTPGTLKAYPADLTADSPGFNVYAGTGFPADTDRVPGMAVYGGKAYIATGISTLSANIVITPTGPAQNATAPPRPTVPPSYTITGGGPLTAITGFIYAYCYLDSATGARGPYLQGLTTGPISNSNVLVRCTGRPTTGFDSIEVYRTSDGGDALRKLGTVANLAGINSYADNTTDDRLSYIQPPRHTGRTPTCRFVLAHMDRLIWAYRTELPIDRNVVYYSEPFAPFCVDPALNTVTVRPDDGDEISGLARLYNRAFVFKTRQIYELADNRPDSPFRIEPIVNEGAIGCVSPQTIVEIEGRLFFLSWMGVALFDGQAPRIIPGPLSALAAEPQLTAADFTAPPAYFSWHFRQADVVPETFHFQVAFTATNADPSHGTITSVSSAITPTSFRVGSAARPFPASGLRFDPGQAETIHFDPTGGGLAQGQTAYVWVRANDGVQWTDYQPQGSWTYIPLQVRTYASNWGLAARFHAVDYWPAHEYHLYVASAGSDVIDTRWALDYRSIDSESGPVWRRDVVQASASVLVAGLNADAANRNLNAVVLGDDNGCVWLSPWPGVDHLVSRATPLTSDLRVADVVVDRVGSYWNLDTVPSGPVLSPPPTWPASPTLAGERVVVVDPDTGEAFTGVVRDSNSARLVVGRWLEGVAPIIGRTYTAAIGGLDAHVDFYPQKLGDGLHALAVRQIMLKGGSQPAELDVEAWTTDSVERLSRSALALLRRQRHTDVACGDNRIKRLPARGRGLYAGGRLSSWRPQPSWMIAAWGLGVQQTGSRR